LDGDTDNGVITFNVATGFGTVENNMLFDGSVLLVTGSVSPRIFTETHSLLPTGGSVTLDLSTANNFSRTVNANATFTFSSAAGGRAFGFTLALSNGGSYIITWPGSIRWVDGTAPLLTSSGTDVLTFYTFDGGNNYYGFLVGLNMSTI
jgi:hypothetical protein